MSGLVVPVGHYLGRVHDDGAGQVRHRVRIGHGSEPLDTEREAAVWFAAHSPPGAAPQPAWTRDRILGLLSDPAGAAPAFDALLRDGMLAEVDDGFADRYRVVPLTYGTGWRPGGDGLDLGPERHRVTVDETVLAVWERGADFATLRAACADAAPQAPDVALAALVADLHRLLSVSAAYVDTAPAGPTAYVDTAPADAAGTETASR